MRKEDQNWRDWFAFSKRERNGNIVLAMLFVLSIFLLVVSQPKDYIPNFQHYTIKPTDSMTTIHSYSSQVSETPILHLRVDPNHATREEWQQLGLKNRQINTIKNFIEKGGQFKYKEDLLKIYTLDSAWVLAAYPYIDLPEKTTLLRDTLKQLDYKQNYIPKTRTPMTIELNYADSSDLMMLPGIGNFFARHILKYRNALGGFHDYDQLKEVWKMTDSKLESLLPFIEIDATRIIPMNVNIAGREELSRHPYLSHRQAEQLVNYREKHGNYTDSLQVIKAALFSEMEWKKVAPYLSFGP